MLKSSFARFLTARGKDHTGSDGSSRPSSTKSWETTTDQDVASDEELFYDTTATPESASQPEISQQSISQSITDGLDDIDVSWHKHAPPVELLILPTDTSMEIESLIEPSIEALKTRHEQEWLLRAERQQQEERRGQEAQSNGKGKGVEHTSGLQPGLQFGTQLSIDESSQTSNGRDTFLAPAHPNWTFWGLRSSKTKARLGGASDSTAISATDSGYGSGAADTSSTNIQLLKSGSVRGRFRRSKEGVNKIPSVCASSTLEECVSCLDDFESNLVINVGCHKYCKACFQTLIDTAIGAEDHWPPKCCLNEISADKILPHLDSKKKTKYNDIVEERLIPAGDRIYCFKASCAAWIPVKNIDKSQFCASCPKCRHKSCTSCRGQFHNSGECPTDPALLATIQLATDEGWRRCYNCQAIVEHNEGCMHMTCKCKASFCYICGKKWRTCGCGLDPPADYLAGIQTRRAAAAAREQAAEQARVAEREAEEEAEELADIIRQIEEFETMEAVRLATEDEARRLVEESARAQHEEARIQAVMTRFRDLNNELEFVHDVQRVALVSQHEQELLAFDRQTKAWDAAKRAHAHELLQAEKQARATISAAQFWFEVEYQERLTKQRVIEDDYARQLTAYWGEIEGGHARIAEGRMRLKEVHADGCRSWYSVRNAEHMEILRGAEEVLEEVKNRVGRETAAMEEEKGRREAELTWRAEANRRWMQAVAGERFTMLQNMEQMEYARVGD